MKLKTRIGLLLISISFAACASAPTGLSPKGVEAFNKTQIIKSLDTLRDIAIDGEKTEPKLISTDTTRKIVLYHRSALLIIDAQGAKAITLVSLDEVVKNLPEKEKNTLGPYIDLVKIVIKQVTQ